MHLPAKVLTPGADAFTEPQLHPATPPHQASSTVVSDW